MLSKVKLKSFKSGFSSMWTDSFQMFKLGLEKAEESNCQYLLYHEESKGIPEKHLLLLHWICKTFDRVDHNKL